MMSYTELLNVAINVDVIIVTGFQNHKFGLCGTAMHELGKSLMSIFVKCRFWEWFFHTWDLDYYKPLKSRCSRLLVLFANEKHINGIHEFGGP